MNKLELAHAYAMEMASQGIKLSSCILLGWRYADKMIEEDEKRKDKGLPEALQDEFVIDWSKAPNDFKWWSAACQDGKITGGWFFKEMPEVGKVGETSIYYDGEDCILTESFGYCGSWWESLRKRPE